MAEIYWKHEGVTIFATHFAFYMKKPPAGNKDTAEIGETRCARGVNFRRLLMSNMIDVKIRMRRMLGAGVAVAALGVGLLAGGRPAMATPSTLGFYPSTDTYADKTFHLDVDTYRADNLGGNGFDTAGITYGIGDTDKAFGRSEVGFDYIASGVGSGSFGNHLLFNGKTQIYNNAENGIKAVAGVWLLGSKNAGASNVGYLLGSKGFKFGRITAGVAHAFRDQGGNSETFVQLGFDRPITSKLSFAADFYSGHGPLSGIQPSLYYAVNDKASFGVGYFINSEPSGAPNNDQLYLCFDYNFGGPKAEAAPAPAKP